MKLLLLLAVLLSTSCSAQDAPVVPAPPVVQPVVPAPPVVQPVTVTTEKQLPDVLYTCVYKYDSKYNVVFLERNRVDYHPPSLPELLVYRIIDTKGQRWSINAYDWKNYTCTKTTLSQG